ncbi:MAG: nucleoside hydrolase, partial [Anaerolineaceae bacterium]|nr:nucleoside hydrolase [Anaerolineaceae bacterium]
GVDDAMMILAALRSPDLEVVGLTTVFGNCPVETGTQNALRLLELEGHGHIPVAQGCSRPLVVTPGEFPADIHGKDGCGNAFPPPPNGRAISQHAAHFIIETCKKHPGEITLAPIGPLTNIGLALQLCPELPRYVKEVVLMGGSCYAGGNLNPVAEANIYHDPHAAEMVFRAGWPLVMLGLDVTTQIILDQSYFQELYAAKNKATDFLSKIQPLYQEFYARTFGFNHKEIHTHDPSVTAYMIKPELFGFMETPVIVETGGRCAGYTIADPLKQWGERPSVKVCTKVDAEAVRQLLLELLRS